jgi:hypothetical protein
MRRTTSFRLLLAGLAVVMGGPAVAQTCAQPSERLGFDVRLVQSQLQVAALQCRDVPGFANLEDQYRSFVQRFQNEFRTSATGLQAYFRRTAGNNHTRALDSYITNLAQAQAAEGSSQGTHYCPLVAPLFRAALSANGLNGLAQLSHERNLLNTVAVTPCPASPPPATRSRPAARGQRTASN